MEKEIGAIVFLLVFNLPSHIIIFFTRLFGADEDGAGVFVLIFCSLMLLGDLIKVVMLATTDFTIRDSPKAAMIGLVAIFVVGYAAGVILQAISGI